MKHRGTHTQPRLFQKNRICLPPAKNLIVHRLALPWSSSWRGVGCGMGCGMAGMSVAGAAWDGTGWGVALAWPWGKFYKNNFNSPTRAWFCLFPLVRLSYCLLLLTMCFYYIIWIVRAYIRDAFDDIFDRQVSFPDVHRHMFDHAPIVYLYFQIICPV